ncbi:MAG: hypothetical protein U9N87_11570 [Planctomycetota bacterium]|nr:hypothetical protein [Planctomycetota bacterium]
MRRYNSLITFFFLTAMVAAVSASNAQEPFDYFENSWNVIGLKDYNRGTRVTPDNRLLLAEKRVVQIRVGRKLTPLSREQTKTLLQGWLPVVLLTTTDAPVRYDIKLWATPLPSARDWKKAFDWPTEGENYLNWIQIQATNMSDKKAEAKVAVDVTGAAKPDGKKFTWSLDPGASRVATFRVPFSPVNGATDFDKEDPNLWLKRTVDYWQGVLADTTHITVPCRKANEAFLASHVCQLIASDHGEVHAGEGFYDRFYIRDGAYQVMEYEEAGMFDAAAKALEAYLRHQRADGRFESQGGQFDANGQALWVLWQYYKMTGDRAWLAKVYPKMRRAVDWTMQTRRQTPADSPFAGLLPNALADGEYLWAGKNHIVGYDFWNLRGILCTADAAKVLGKEDTAQELFEEAAAYRKAIDAAWKRTGLAYFPPSWEKEGTHWGNTETLWPTELFAVDDPRVAALDKHVREDFGGGFTEGTIRWLGGTKQGWKHCSHPYMGAYTTMASLARGEHEQVVEDFYWYLLHSTAAHAFPEGILYDRRFAWSDTIPHATGACNYAIMLRHILIHEQGEELHILRAVPDWWLGEGKEIRVERAPTHFGEMSLTIRGTKSGVRVDLDPPRRRPPKRIVLHLPKSRPLDGELKSVRVEYRAEQTNRWDFPAVVKKYREAKSKTAAEKL